MGEEQYLTAGDGHRLEAYVAHPQSTPRAGLVICQEVMGVNAHIRAVTDGFAAEGYLAIAPAFFDRKEPKAALDYSKQSLTRGREIRDSISWTEVVMDANAAVKFAERAGKVSVVGYCWGGSIAWLAACRLRISAAVGYYGGQIHPHREETPECPTLLHFGDRDHMVPMAHVDDIRKRHPDVAIHVYPAGHGFNCDARAAFEPESARLARTRTLAFLAKHIV